MLLKIILKEFVEDAIQIFCNALLLFYTLCKFLQNASKIYVSECVHVLISTSYLRTSISLCISVDLFILLILFVFCALEK